MPALIATHRIAALNKGVVYDPSASALFARMTTPPSAARKASINAAIVSLKSLGLWSKLDALYVLAAADRQAAKLNWVSTSFDLTEIDGANLTFTADVGFQGNGTSSKLSTGFNPVVAGSGSRFQTTSGSIGFWSFTPGITAGADMGNANTQLQCRRTSNVADHGVNAYTRGSALGVADGTGLFVTSRVGPTSADNLLYRDGVPYAINTPTSGFAKDNSTIFVLGTNTDFGAKGCQLAFIGAGLSGPEIVSFRSVFA